MSESSAPNQSFGERVDLCCKRAGSAAALARLVGLSHTAIAKYQNNEAEPAVSIVVKMADAVGVSLVWLATGKGSPLGSVSSKKLEEDSANTIPGFTERLREANALLRRRMGHLGITDGFDPVRLNELLDGATPEIRDIIALSNSALFPLAYVLNGYGAPDVSRAELSDEYAFSNLIAKLRGIDAKRYINIWPENDPRHTPAFPPYWQDPFFELVAEAYESLKPHRLVLHKYTGDTMNRLLQNGDRLLALAEASPSRPGIYILNQVGAEPKSANTHYVARIGIVNSAYRITYDNRRLEPSDLDPEKIQVVGRVIRIFRSIGD
jgi:transcriptional regulator with XRE-family HTH domain